MSEDRKTLVICGSDGTPLDVASQNDKGFRKTVERGELWALHGETGKLLPYSEGTPVRIMDKGSWYLAIVDVTDGESPAAPSNAAGPDADVSEPVAGRPGSSIGPVLDSLAALIRTRHEEMPEGSYTTHLFSGGGARVRKKTGEEAVELVLAADKQEMTSEASDLIYHLLVLLELEGISLDEIAAELKRR